MSYENNRTDYNAAYYIKNKDRIKQRYEDKKVSLNLTEIKRVVKGLRKIIGEANAQIVITEVEQFASKEKEFVK